MSASFSLLSNAHGKGIWGPGAWRPFALGSSASKNTELSAGVEAH